MPITQTTNEYAVVNESDPLRSRNPFVGLRPFNTDESILFFGRRQQTIELMEKLHETHFIAVVGSSGCGKSSLIRAGLIPNLRAGFLAEDRDQWLVAMMKPGDAPLRNLAKALIEAVLAEDDAEHLAEAIRAGGAQAILEKLSPTVIHSDANLLLLVDQFEEIFRFGVESSKPEQRVEAEDFVSILLALAEQRRAPIYVVMTMRSDFLGDCDNFYGLPEAMNRSQYLVPRLTRQQRQQAIEAPIRLFGASISPRLLDRLLNDVGDKSDQLPVMQHALMRTWEEWEREAAGRQGHGATGRDDNPQFAIRNPQSIQVDLPHYEAAGGIENALSKDAEASLNGLSDDEFKVAERMFQTLTDTDARNRHIRRPAHLSEIVDVTGADRETIMNIIERFTSGGRSFLSMTNDDDPLIDISHESLIRQWERMIWWVWNESGSGATYKRLMDAASVYEMSGGKKNDLLQGTQLDLALEWQAQRAPNRMWARRYHLDIESEDADRRFDSAIGFLKESKKARDEEETSRQRQLRKRRVATALLALLGFGLATVFGVLALNLDAAKKMSDSFRASAEFEKKKADEQRQEALKQKDAAEEEKKNAEEQRLKAENNFKEAEKQRLLADLANQQSEQGRRQVAQLLYDADLNLAQNAFDNNNSSRGYELLNAYLPPAPYSNLRSFYWFHLWQSNHQELQTLKGHESYIISVAFSPDSKTLASASNDKTVKLWDAASRQPLATLKGHESPVTSVAFSPDGKTLASASEDKTVRLWDVVSRRLLGTLREHENDVYSVAFSPDGKTLASASGDKTVRLWDAVSRQPLATLKGHEEAVFSIAFSPDGKTLASASSDNTVKLWDVVSLQPLATLKGHEDRVISVAFSPDGKTLASASEDKTMRLWGVVSRQLLGTLNGHESFVFSVAFSPDSKTLASASSDNTVKLWDAVLRQPLATLKGHEEAVFSIAFSPDGKTLASASFDKTVKLWDAVLRQPLATLKGHEEAVFSVVFSPDGKMLASANLDSTVKLWSVVSRQLLGTLKGHESLVFSVAFSPDGKALASASGDKTVRLWDVVSRQPLATLKGHEDRVISVAFSPDGKTLASASSDNTVKLWDVVSRQPLATLKGHESYVNSVAFSPDGKTLASASGDEMMRLWDAVSREPLGTLKGHEAVVKSVAFSPDGKTVASASEDKTVRLWDVVSRQPLATFKGHEDDVNSVAFSPDGKTLASASDDKMVRLWDVVSRQLLGTLKGHESYVQSVAFSPDGKTLTSAGGGDEKKKEFAIRLWFAATDEDVARQRNK